MNRYNDWKNLLRIANEDLEKTGYSILITEPEEGCYDCEIWKGERLYTIFAEGYYEDELSDLVTEAAHYALSLAR